MQRFRFFTMISALLSGLLIAVSFPTFIAGISFPDLGPLAWFALVPLYVVTRRTSFFTNFLLGTLCGFIANAAQYWVFIAIHSYAKYPMDWTLIVLFLTYGGVALYVGLAFSLAGWIGQRLCLSRVWILPFLWVVTDFIRNFFPFGGLPWTNLAYSQSGFLTLLQMADVTGVYGILFLIILVNALLGELVVTLMEKRFRSSYPWPALVLCSLLFMLSLGYGHMRLAETRQPTDRAGVSVALIHGSRPSGFRYSREQARAAHELNEALSQDAVAAGADMVMWPEASFYGAFRNDDHLIVKTAPLGVPLVIGGVTVGDAGHHNSALFVDGAGKIQSIYDKIHLVPIGEYVPWPRLLGFLHTINPGSLKFVPGTKPVLFSLPRDPPVPFGMMICYEDLFPEIARANTLAGAEFLGVIVSDGWFEATSATRQHWVFSQLRAIENRRFVARAANKGISGVIDPWGRTMIRTDELREQSLTGTVVPQTSFSLYTRWGDWFAKLCSGVVVCVTVAAALPRRSLVRAFQRTATEERAYVA